MRLNTDNRRLQAGYRSYLLVIATAVWLVLPAAAFAQGSIFGTVQNSNLSTPADGDILFFGFLDDTDEEIRIELSDGAGYQSGNWFDDFQNYLTEAAGNPYDYYFVNIVNGESFHLGKPIPSNSFQQEDILLVAGVLPARPTNLSARAISSSRMYVAWTGAPGLTYHVYRRLSTSNGSFFRVDNPAGSLANPGVADTFFVDTTVDGISSYTYLVIAQNGSGVYSAHSAPVTGNSSILTAPVVNSITPNSGPSVGGTAVTINGAGFDAAGLTVTFSGNPATGITVVNAGRITATSPAGTGSVNIIVTNTSAGLSGTLVGGFNYFTNSPPVANAGPDQLGQFKNTIITLNGTGSSDVNGDSLFYSWLQTSGPAVSLSSNSVAQPTFTASANGDYFFRLIVNDGIVNSAPDTVRVQVVERAPVLAAIGPRNVTEGANLNFNATATDADGTTPTLSAVNLPAGASFVNNGNGTGTFNFTPTFVQAGVYNVTFIASDGVLADSEVVAITVNEAGNQRPVLAAIGPRSVTEGLVLNFNTTATDADATIPTLSAVNLPANATFINNGNGTGTFNFAPNFTQAGVYNVTFIASDGTLADSEVVAITVNEFGNQRPVLAAIGPRSVTEGLVLNFNATATDADGTIPAMTAVNVPLNATFVDNGNGSGTFNFAPTFVQAGVYNVTFIASDGTLADSEIVAITVNDGGNQRPVLAAIGPRNVTEGLNLNFNISATDPDNTTPALTAVGLPSGASFVNNGNGTGTFDFTPSFIQAGVYNVTFIASDGVLADSEVVAVTVNEAGNQRPVLAAIGPRNVTEGQVLNINATATDVDATIPALSAVNLPLNASFIDNGNGSGTFNFAPNFVQAGVYNVTFIASDGTLADSEVVAITVIEAGNQRPVLAAIGPRFTNEGVNLNFNISATDPEGVIPTFAAVGLPANASLVDNGNGTATFDFNPGFTQAGVYNVTFITSDGVLADSEVVVVTVLDSGNQRPVLAAIGPRSVTEGINLNFNISATDPDITIPVLTAVNLPAGATFVNNLDGTGTFNFTPTFVQAGVYNVTFIASDGVLADSEVVAVTVNEAGNQTPVLAAIGPRNVTEGQVLNFNATATDVDATIPALSAVGLPANATFIDNGNGSGTFNFAPNFIQAGVYNVTFIASDGTLADSEVVAITVIEAGNQRPVLATIGPRFTNEGVNLNFNISATDPEGVIPTFAAVGLPANSSLVDNLDGTATFDFTPDFTQAGVYNVTFITSDGVLADSEVVAVTVLDGGNQRPVLAAIGPQLVTEGVNLNFNISAVDPDLTIPVLSAAGLPLGATFVNNLDGTGTFDFTPNFAQSGVYNVTFVATDGVLADSEVVQITVNDAGNQAPVLAAVGPRNVNEGVVLNFIVTATDPDATIPTLTAEGVPLNATFIDNGNGSGTFNFAPDFTQAGVYNLTFIASDGILADTEIVAVTVNEANRPPVLAAIGPRNVNEGVLLTFGISASDLDGTIPTLAAANLPANATLLDNLNGTATFSFTPSFAQAGVYNVTFIASDGLLADSEVVAITVNEAGNQSPILALIGNRAVQEGGTLEFRVSANDPDGTVPTLAATNVPLNAAFVDSANGAGSFTFSPNFNQAGFYNVLFVASDGLSADSEMVQITVGEFGNIPPILNPIGPQQIAENNVLTILISATDETSPPSLLLSTLMTNYVFVDSGNGMGTFTYSPDYFDAGLDSVTFFAIDQDGAIDQEKVLITTVDINRPPQILPSLPNITAVPGDSVKFHIVASDSTDPNGGRLYLLALQKPTTSVFVDSANNRGSLRWLPTIADTGVHQFIVLVTDDETPALSTRDTALITVNVSNQAPVLASIGPKSVLEGDTLEFRFSATDPDGSIPFFYAQNIPVNAVLVDSSNGAGSFFFSPSFTQSGLYSVKFFASDGNRTDNEIVLIQVINVPQPPEITVPASPQIVTEGEVLEFGMSATDPDGTIPSFVLAGISPLPANAALVDSGNGAASFRFAPVFVQSGIYNMYFIATDGARSDTGLVTINCQDAGNQTPVITITRSGSPLNDGDTTSIQEGQLLVLNASATDADSTITLLSTTTPLPHTATFVDNINSTGVFNWQTENLHVGVYNVTFYATDGISSGIVDSTHVVIRVTDLNFSPGVLTYEPQGVCFSPSTGCAATVPEGGLLTFKFYSFGGDPDLTSPIFTAFPFTITGTDTTVLMTTPLPANMTVVDNGDTATFAFTPSFQQQGTYRIMFLLIDETNPDDVERSPWTFTVTNVSVPPVLNPVGPLSVVEGATLDVNISGSDPDGLPVILSSTTLPAGATLTPLTGQPAGTATSRLLYTPGFAAAGAYNVWFRVREQTPPLADSELVTITVIEAGPQAPVITAIPTAYTVNVGDTESLWLRATDVDSPPPTFSLFGSPVAPWNGVLVDSANGRASYRFTPILNQEDSIYTVNFVATSGDSRADTLTVVFTVINGICGDANSDGIVSITDVVFLISYIFGGGPAPASLREGDPNGDGVTSVSDAVYIITYIFGGGPAPNCD